MADDHAARAAGESAVGEEADLFAEPLSRQRRRDREHFAHAWTADRPLAADDDDIARLDTAILQGGEARLLAVEDLCRPGDLARLQARHLGDRAVRREIAVQDDDVPRWMHRRADRLDHLLFAG